MRDTTKTAGETMPDKDVITFMKKTSILTIIFLLFVLSSIFVLLIAAGCSSYNINKEKSGIFDMTVMSGNLFSGSKGMCKFDLNKRTFEKDSFFGIDIGYSYIGTGFDIDKYKGMKIILNGTKSFYIRSRKRHICNMYGGSMTVAGGAARVSIPDTVMYMYGILTKKQLENMALADSIKIVYISPVRNDGTVEERSFDFTRENKENIKRFYNEYGKKTAGGGI